MIDNSEITLPNYGTIAYSNAIAEKRLETRRPDVSAVYEGQPIFFEIFVSHAVDSKKDKFFTDGKYKSVEIDLSNFLTTSFEEIKDLVINKIKTKRIICWGDEIATAQEITVQNKNLQKNNINFRKLVFGSLIIFAIFKTIPFFFPKKKKGKKEEDKHINGSFFYTSTVLHPLHPEQYPTVLQLHN